MKIKSLSILSISLLFVLISCAKKHNVSQLVELKEDKLDFDYFKSKAKLNLELPDESVSATLNIRIQDSSIIWMSLNKYGKEAARLKFQPDSTYYMNRYPADNQFYSILSTQEYLKKAGLDIDYNSFQGLFFGKHPLKIEKKDSVYRKDSNVVVIQRREGARIETVLSKVNSKLISTLVTSKEKQDTIWVNYKNYQQVGAYYIPTLFDFKVSKSTDSTRFKSSMTIEMTSPEFVAEELSFNFVIPEDYEKR